MAESQVDVHLGIFLSHFTEYLLANAELKSQVV